MGANSGVEARKHAVMTAALKKPRRAEPPRDAEGRVRVSSEYGARTLDLHKLQDRLPKAVFQRLQACVDLGEPLDQSSADAVAHAAKEWALENGATHFCHWFQPLTGLTAEKHDAFFKLEDGQAIERFSGSELIQSEPDASSFPSGGIRTTFEARGYTAWDPASPMFLMGNSTGWTLCIPSAYLSYNGHALDQKAGLLRSIQSVQSAVRDLMDALGWERPARVTATVGPEQEYFLVDRAFASLRPDLLLAKRTVVGAPAPKGQQLDDHYFGSISPRVRAFMNEFEHELYQLGVPCKTRHNEVAPGQYESAPIFEEANVAADHNQLTMEVMRRIANRHDFEVIFHEKPFAGVNGTGKHLNWSIAARGADGEWSNLFEPGETPETNLRFLLMTAAALRCVHRHAGVMRAAISGAGNDHRLGANEAPPAIISVFMGTTLSAIFDRLAAGEFGEGSAHDAMLDLGVSGVPNIRRDNTDRNRTSPFAFTGNKWEFRAAGGSQSASFPIAVLNAGIAGALGEMAAAVRDGVQGGKEPEDAALDVLKAVAAETTPIRFEGDNYSDAWVEQAEGRGLPNLRKTSDALAWLAEPKNHQFLIDQKVHTAEEIEARIHVHTERYLNDIEIESALLVRFTDTLILPAASSYFGDLCTSIAAAKSIGKDAPQSARAGEVAALLSELTTARDAFVALQASIGAEAKDDHDKAHRYAYELMPAMLRVRAAADGLEVLCGDSYWPLPSYQEMLFVR